MNQDRYIPFHLNDILADQEAVAAALMTACHRMPNAKLQALCQLDDKILVILSECPVGCSPDDIRWLELPDDNWETLQALLAKRWEAAYEPLGLVSSIDNNTNITRLLLIQRPGNHAELV